MHSRAFRLLFLVAASGIAVAGVCSDRAAAAPLDLQEAVTLALAKSPHVKASEEALGIAEARKKGALAARLPRVDFEEFYLRTDQPVTSFSSLLNQGRFTSDMLNPAADPSLSALNNPDTLDNFRTRFAVKQPLFAGGRLHFQDRMQSQEVEAARSEVSGARAETAFLAVQAYLGLSLARESVEVAQAAVTAAEASLREIELLFKEGTVVRSDLLSARVQLADFKDQDVRAKGDERLAQLRLAVLIGESPDGRWETARLCPPGDIEAVEQSPERLFQLAKEKRPDYAALGARREAAGLGLKAAKGSFLPSVGVEASYEWNAPRFAEDLEGSYLLGVGFNWNLFNGLGDWAKLGEARGNRALAGFALRRLEDSMLMEVEEAAVAVATSRESLQVTRERVGMAEESLRIIRQRYREGLTTIVELQQAELALSRSRLAWYKVVYDLRVAIARLRLVTGELPDAVPRLSCAETPTP